jgi:hypothetical protein
VNWIDYDTLELIVSISDDASTGTRDVGVLNPVGAGFGACIDCFTVT